LTVGVVIADRSAFVRLAARSALTLEGIAVLAEAEDAATAHAAALAHRPDVMLFDAELDPDLETLTRIHEALPETALIVLSPDDSDAHAVAAVRVGACGFLPKDTSPDRLPAIVRGAVDGEAAIPRRVVRGLLRRIAAQGVTGPAGLLVTDHPLTGREREVLSRIAQGMADRQIGAELGVSEVTVRRHAATAARKLHAVRREDAVAAFRRLVA
jgi:DNA-binding NarL/FixJ family response regulator